MTTRFSRRKALKSAGLLTAAATVSGGLVAAAVNGPEPARGASASPPKRRNRQWAMAIDLRKCDGCVTVDKAPQCTEACNRQHFVPEGQQWMRVFQVADAGGGTFMRPQPCMHCENPPCTNVCPVRATYREDDGIVLIDNTRCIGCRMCMAACPYGARSFNWDEPAKPPAATFAEHRPEFPVVHRRGTVDKCMLCAHRTEDGKLPACVDGCPMNAIFLADLVEDIATNGKDIVQFERFRAENNAYRLKEELGTRPRVWYIPGHGQEYGREHTDGRTPAKPRSWQQQPQGARPAMGAGHD